MIKAWDATLSQRWANAMRLKIVMKESYLLSVSSKHIDNSVFIINLKMPQVPVDVVMSFKKEIIMQLCMLLLIPLFCRACTAVNTDTAAIYDPVIPHRRMPQHTTSWKYPYFYDYPYRVTGGQSRTRLTKAVTATPSKSNSNYYYPYRYRYPYRYAYQNPSPVSPNFHAVNQVEFVEPVAPASFSGNVMKRPWKKSRLHPHPTVTILGPGGAGSGGGDAGGGGGGDGGG